MLLFSAVLSETEKSTQEIIIDETLFTRIGSGDRDAFRDLYEQTRTAVYAYALSLLRNAHDAEDTTQEVYLKIRSAAHLYQPQGKPMAWILTITKNICRHKQRSLSRFVQSPFAEQSEADLLDSISDAEDRIVLQEAFTVLDKTECRIIMLHAAAGIKHREIAALLDMPTTTVLSKYSRGLKKLRKQLEGQL